VELAVQDLDAALSPSLWSRTQTDGNHIDPALGGQVFAHTANAVQDLETVGANPPEWDATAIAFLAYAARLIASTAISDNSCNSVHRDGGRAAEVALSAGDKRLDQGRDDDAVDAYGHAWNEAEQAGRSSCASGAISVTPLPTLFNVVNMSPGDHAVMPVSLTVTGTMTGQVAMYVQNLVSTSCSQNNLRCPPGAGTGILANQLNLTIFDGTTGLTLYSGALSNLPILPASLTICGIGSTSATGAGCKFPWSINETHNLTFSITFPATGRPDNSFQGTGTSVQFVWGRTDCLRREHGCRNENGSYGPGRRGS
jgi:hypothetical protein